MDEYQKRVFKFPQHKLFDRMAGHILEKATGEASLASKWHDGDLDSAPFSRAKIEECCRGFPGLYDREISPLLDRLIAEFSATEKPSIEGVKESLMQALDLTAADIF